MSLVLVGPVCDPVPSRLGTGPGHVAAPPPWGTGFSFHFFPAAVGFHHCSKDSRFGVLPPAV